ncbi:MAG: GNAT family N-acetyltransferase [Gemmatimonadales bacterium]
MPLLRATLVSLAVVLVIAPAMVVGSARGRAGGLWSRARDVARLILSGNLKKALWAIRYRLRSDSTSTGLRRDLTIPFNGPSAKIPFEVRPLAPTDDLTALNPGQAGISSEEMFWRLAQQRLLHSGLETCYVAIGPDGKPCFMQWLVLAPDNDRLRSTFGNLYPTLAPDEALLEGAFTPETSRGLGIMSAAMAKIAERAKEGGARWVITFVDEGNVASVKGCLRAGFTPYVSRNESFRWFRRRISFRPVFPSASGTATSRP